MEGSCAIALSDNKMLVNSIQPLQEKKHALELELNKLRSQEEIYRRKTEEASQNATALENRLETLKGSLSNNARVAQEIAEFTQSLIGRAMGLLHDAALSIDRSQQGLNDLTVRLGTVEKREIEIGILLDERHQELVREEERLNIRAKDLEIYKTRLQKKYDELQLGPLLV